MSHWYIMDKSMKINFSIMMTRAQKPIIFKAGGFVPLSLYTFLMVIEITKNYFYILFQNQ